jgi:uncharacterized membrane protein
MFKGFSPAAFAGSVFLSVSAAGAGTLVPVPPYPDSTQMFASGINNDGMLAGHYFDQGFAHHGFFGPFGGPYTAFDFPNGGTFVFSIADDGTIDGDTDFSNPDCPISNCQYLRKPNGTIKTLMHHGAPADGLPGELAPKSKFVGEIWSQDQDLNVLITGYVGKDVQYKSQIDLPFASKRVRPRGLNKKGMVDGYYQTSDGSYAGFVIRDGVATSTSFPDADAFYTQLEGSNAKGQIVGGWFNQDKSAGQAFLYDLDTDTYDVIKVPGEASSVARRINDKGVVTVLGNTTGSSYLYCRRKRDCPSSAGAIEIADRWVKAKSGGHRWALCGSDCLKPMPASLPKASPEAIGRDPVMAREHRQGLD